MWVGIWERFDNVLITVLFRRTTARLYRPYGYFMRGWGFGKRFGDGFCTFFLGLLLEVFLCDGKVVVAGKVIV